MKYLFLIFILCAQAAYSQTIPPQYMPGAVLNHDLNYRRYYQNKQQINYIPSSSLEPPESDIYIEEDVLPPESSAYGLLKVPNSDKVFIIGPE